MEGEAAIIDAEIKRLQGLKKSRENTAARLKTTISEAMQLFGVQEIKTPVLKLCFLKSTTVETDENLDANFVKTTTTTAPDKAAIKAAINAGEVVNGARLVEHFNLQIK